MKQEILLNSDQFKPAKGLVLVKPINLQKEKKTETGIVFDLGNKKSVNERPSHGEIVALGDHKEDNELFEVGTVVCWPIQDGIDLEFLDGDFILLRVTSIIGSKL